MEFLKGRYENELKEQKHLDRIVIMDWCIYEDFFVFAKS